MPKLLIVLMQRVYFGHRAAWNVPCVARRVLDQLSALSLDDSRGSSMSFTETDKVTDLNTA